MKMMKKILPLLLCLPLLFSAVPAVQAEGINLINNGGFEQVKDGKVTDWTLVGGAAGTEFTISENAREGENALSMQSADGKSIFIATNVRDLIPGETYTVSGFVMLPEGTDGFAAKAEYRNADNATFDGSDEGFSFPDVTKSNRWQTFSFSMKAPSQADRVTILFRSTKGLQVVLDDIQVTGKVKPAVQNCEFLEPLEDAPDLITNGGFEEKDGDGARDWTGHAKTWTGLATIAEDGEHGNVLRLLDSGASNPWGMQFVMNLQPGATYQVTADLKTLAVSNGVSFKTEFYKDNTNSAATFVTQTGSEYFVPTKGEWQQIAYSFDIPLEANSVCLYARMYGAGEVYYDNVSLRMVEAAPCLEVGSDAFVYSNWEEAQAYARFNEAAYEREEGSRLQFTLLDGEKTLDTAVSVNSAYSVYTFDVALLSEKQKEYTIRVEYIGADGRIIESYDEPIYKYDRPSRLTEDGRFITPDGEKIQMSIGYHVNTEHYADAAEIGINAVQVYAADSAEAIEKRLDALEEAGIYGFLNLYAGMKPAAHADNLDHTIEIVNAVKDHPALMGYMTMDEPFINDPTGYEDLRASYKLFRDMDPEKPVYIVECERQWLYKTVTVCDLFAIDPYPTASRPHETHISDFSRTADIVNTHKKPLINILQAYELGGWEPESMDMRHMAYQAFFANNTGVGYYPLSDAGGLLNDEARTRENFLYEGVKFFMQEEYEDAFCAFVTKEYPSFSELSNDRHPVWYKGYIKEGEPYFVVLNRTEEEKTVHIPLQSGGVAVGAFTAVGADFAELPEITGNGTLSLTLMPSQIVRYKLVTDSALDASLLSRSAFTDTADYAWAEEAIGTTSVLGITNVTSGEYRPGENITRGEFAMFLVRALGLAGEKAGTQFADVDPAAEYALELAIGRVAGILNGIGNDMYNPEAPITRQEMMTIIARGMELTGTADLSPFSDSGLIADWAADCVSAMVESGLIQGNADGTINPLGSTTRAEAAVIMQRILDRIEAAEVKRSDDAVPLEKLDV